MTAFGAMANPYLQWCRQRSPKFDVTTLTPGVHGREVTVWELREPFSDLSRS